MDTSVVSAAVRERLGIEATAGLVDLLEVARQEWTDEVMVLSSERFERRLVEEASAVRLDVVRGNAALRHEVGELRLELRLGFADVRQDLRQEVTRLHQELHHEVTGLRQELHHEVAGLRQELRQGTAELRQEMAANKFDLLKWSFVFWIGQVLAIAGIIGALLRAAGH